MPGRQAHGRPLLAAQKAKSSSKKSKARSHKNALDAFGIALERFPSRQTKTPRARQLDAETESERKHGRNEDGGMEEEDVDDEPKRKKSKASSGAVREDAGEHGSDSEGNEWMMGGLASGHEDSEIESDDAFGESDDDKFQGYTFRGSKPKKDETDDSEGDSDDEEGETLGADAIDLATALDQFEEDDSEEPKGDEKSGSEESGDDESEVSGESESEDGDEEADDKQLEAMRGLVSEYAGEGAEEGKAHQSGSKRKIGVGELGLASIDDPILKRSVKLMTKEAKEKRPGAAKKLDVPLPKRQQDRQDRAVAYEKTKETLDRWTETVKQNRRADHLIFPLPQNSATAGLDTTEMQTLTTKSATNELESTIMSIMDQSELSMQKQKQSKSKPQEFDDEGKLLSRKEAIKKRRMQREVMEREAKRAKRIKKIKSKAYHRVHRRQKERDEMAAKEAMEEAGEIDSEAEREAQDRRRALERVGQRHKESRWAKMGAKTKRAVWDDDFRQGLTEMARKDEELRRRKEGKKGDAEASDSDASSGSGDDSDDDDDDKLRRRLDKLEAQGAEEPTSGLMSMKFMQKAETARKKANDDLVRQIRRELDGEDETAGSEGETEVKDVGRRRFGGSGPVKTSRPVLDTPKRTARGEDTSREEGDAGLTTRDDEACEFVLSGEPASTAGAWSRGEARRSKIKGRVEELDVVSTTLIAKEASKTNPKAKASNRTKSKPHDDASNQPPTHDSDTSSTSSSDTDTDTDPTPNPGSQHALLTRAFASDAIATAFALEKSATQAADADKTIDTTLPGWGSWVGDGVSERDKSRHRHRFLTHIPGVKMEERRDAKLDKVIINEKRVKKNDAYLASHLPHPFESREQYERSLRLPIGPEWLTKSSFTQSVKPRVLMKQGVIAPMSKPMV
ncbi:hypothetical protein CDD80_2300 [Ophiocordyceps camponoti-rufipedis]|uniref:Uncharacterized protein n=1 Tax=Ophiocordyceps camponoti-rufipedis TaxID=2004952 RepID=A0A2C5Z151_9HYPO|nr:hypothetical protein CDD80_2300 [Ophiocordyceps camponoti-rufipedis]